MSEADIDKNDLPGKIYLILGDGKPIYYFSEVFLINELNGIINEDLTRIYKPLIIPLPVIQIMFNESMFRDRSILEPYVIRDKVIEMEIVSNLLGNNDFIKTISLFRKLLSRPYDNLFTIQPLLKPSLIIQELKHGKIDVSFAYLALHRSPDSYHTLIRLLDLIDRIYGEINEKVDVEIFIFSKESHLNYLIIQEVINVLNNLSGQKNQRNYRISGIHYAVLHEEIDELKKLFIQNINLLGKNLDTVSYLNMKVPLYDFIGEIYASLMRIYSPKDYAGEWGINGYRLQLCTPDKPYSLLIRVLYELYRMNAIIDADKITLYIEPIRIGDNEYIVEPDIHFLTIHRCPRFRPLKSISEETSVVAVNKSGHYIVSCKLVLKIKKRIKNYYYGSEGRGEDKGKYDELRYTGLYSPRNPYSRESIYIYIPKSCIDRRICPISTFHHNYLTEPLFSSPYIRKFIVNEHYSQTTINVRKIIVDDKEEHLYREEEYETIEEVSLKLWACLREQPLSFIRFLLTLYPWNLNVLSERLDHDDELVLLHNLKNMLSEVLHTDLEHSSISENYSIIAGVSHECLTKHDSPESVERRNFSELYFIKNRLLFRIINNNNINMDKRLVYPIEKVLFVIKDFLNRNNPSNDVAMVIKRYFEKVLENVRFFSEFGGAAGNGIEYRSFTYINEDDLIDDLLGKYYLITRRYFSCDEYRCVLGKVKPLFLINDYYFGLLQNDRYILKTSYELLENILDDLIIKKIKEILHSLNSLSSENDKKMKICQLFSPRLIIPIIDLEVEEIDEHQLIVALDFDLARMGLKLGDIKRGSFKVKRKELKNCLRNIRFVEIDLGRLCGLGIIHVEDEVSKQINRFLEENDYDFPSLYDKLFNNFNSNTYYEDDLLALLDLINYIDRRVYDLNYYIDKIWDRIKRIYTEEDFSKTHKGLRVLLQEISEIKHMNLLPIRKPIDEEEYEPTPRIDIRVLKNLYEFIFS